jgi:cupin superfamily acireductone dioxygenase involved in methionine salvage
LYFITKKIECVDSIGLNYLQGSASINDHEDLRQHQSRDLAEQQKLKLEQYDALLQLAASQQAQIVAYDAQNRQLDAQLASEKADKAMIEQQRDSFSELAAHFAKVGCNRNAQQLAMAPNLCTSYNQS